MNDFLMFDYFPLWGVYFITVGIVLLSVEIGYRLGHSHRRRSKLEQKLPVGSIVSAMLGLLAFMLAFTFGLTASRFDVRKQLLLDDVNTIGTTFLRAGLLVEPHRTEIRNLLRQYVDLQSNPPVEPEKIQEMFKHFEFIHSQLWDHAQALVQVSRNSEIDALFIESLNEMIDLYSKRVTFGFQYRIPIVIWQVLYIVSILSMISVGYQFGLSRVRGIMITIALALTFSAVILLIVELDRAGKGSIKASNQPMIELHQKLIESP